MKILKKSLVIVLAIIVGLTTSNFAKPVSVLAATSPDLKTAAGYGVLSSTFTRNVGLTTVTGNVGYTTLSGSGTLTVNGSIITPKASQAGLDQNAALATLNSQSCTFNFTDGALHLDSDTTHGTIGVYTPGVYCSTGAMDIAGGSTITLNGAGTYIFRSAGAFNTTDNSKVVLGPDASACDVFWTPVATTLGANSEFVGTIIDNSAITVGKSVTWLGRALNYATTVTTDTDTITVPTCAAAPTTVNLHVVKEVTNNNGGVATSSTFNLHVKLAESEVAGSPALGVSSPGTLYSLSAGTYVVSEDVNDLYTKSFSGDCNSSGSVSLIAGDNKICTITNDDIAVSEPSPPDSIVIPTSTIKVIKTVINNNGGTKKVANFPLFVNNTSVISGVANIFSAPATYTVTETKDSNYAQSFSDSCPGGIISIIPGDNKICTITNDDIAVSEPNDSFSNNPATINVVKVVINDSGRTKTVADFPLFVNDTLVVSGETNIFRAPASTYYVTETPDPNYTRTFSGDCDVNGGIRLSPGDNKFCIITNNDIGIPAAIPPVAPIIDVVKVPSPLALPSGPGLVNYTYTVRNIGTIPMTNITMVGDTCSPIVLASGDTNSNAKLDLTETWVYRCSTTLLETHTNTVVATGWANGLSAVDIASATVIVGVPIIPPLIHVTKVPSPLALLNGGGLVTYTEKITNPGTVALSDVKLVDDKCSPMKYISGDLNKDSKLDSTETWTYTCQTKLTKTTTNTAVASGVANGLTVRDFAIVTVVVAMPAPKLPGTGLPDNNVIVDILSALAIVLVSTSFIVALKKRNY